MSDDLGKTVTVTVEVTGAKSGYATVVKASVATASVVAAVFTTMPVPTLTGATVVGQTLTASVGTWMPVVDSVSYVWKRSGVVITGANASVYVLVSADATKALTVEVTGIKAGYTSVVKASVATATVTAH